MKETIYTIPVNEAFDDFSECPFCKIKDRLEKEAVEYALGAAMMEPDYRILSNEKGYCNKHYSLLFSKTNKLSLALVLDTHMEEIRAEIEKYSNGIGKKSGGIFKKGSSSSQLAGYLEKQEKSCLICEKIEKTMERYISIFFEMIKKDEKFKLKVENSNGFCLPHFRELLIYGEKKLSAESFCEFSKMLTQKQIRELERIQEDIHKFTLKFDYRNAEMEWGSAKDAPIRTIEKIAGTILQVNDENLSCN